MRICSFLPSGTEILFALGLEDSIMGINTFECDYPPEARTKPVVVYSKLPSGFGQREIDRQVKDFSVAGKSLYRLDTEKLIEIRPDLIVTQDLCHVCAASPGDLETVLACLSPAPQVLALSPRTIVDIWNDILTVGETTDRLPEAQQLVSTLRAQVRDVERESFEPAPRVLCLEWLDPPFVAGHWVPEMVALAGGIDILGRRGEPGYEVDWGTIVSSDPDLVLAIPCGYHEQEVETELQKVPFPPEWHLLRAVRNKNVFAMDASSYFSRPGPRIADGIGVLAKLFEGIRQRERKAGRAA